MKTEHIISEASLQLPKGFTLEYDSVANVFSGTQTAVLKSPHGELFHFVMDVKQVHRKESLPVSGLVHDKLPHLLVSNPLTPALAAYCAENQVNYIDTAGNACIQLPGLYVLVAGKKTRRAIPERGRFPEGVMKLLFVLLSEPDSLNKPYRVLAKLAGISLGMVSKAFDYLEQQRYYRKAKSGRRLIDAPEVCSQWIKDYPRSLKSRLDQLKLSLPENVNTLELSIGEVESGELAAARYSDNYLMPASGVIYTPHSLMQRSKELALKTSHDAKFELLATFWGAYTLNSRAKAMLCLADLMEYGDDRNREIARMINDKYLNLNEASLFSH